MDKQKPLLYIVPYWNTFIRSDLEMLKEEREVRALAFGNNNDLLIPFYLLRQAVLCFYLLSTRNFTIFIQFGGYHSLLPTIIGKLFGRKSIVIVHGTDACSFKEINYGILRKKLLRLFCFITYKYCAKILPVSSSLIKTENTYFNGSKLEFGLIKEFPSIDINKIHVVHNGLNTDLWPSFSIEKKYTFITVAGGQSIKQARKGFDLMIEVAKYFPDCSFVIVGLKEYKEKFIAKNILFLPATSQAELSKIFNESTFYFQLSIFEGFGLALCEAMLSGCVPIVSNANMMPEIIGKSGFILNRRNLLELRELIVSIMRYSESEIKQKAILARNEIVEKYPLQKRKERLISVISA